MDRFARRRLLPAALSEALDRAEIAVRPLKSITIDDLQQHRVWLYQSAGSDEAALVAPVPRQTLTDNEDDIFIATTEFTLADGSQWVGYCSPSDDSGLDYIQPVIVTSFGRHIRLYFEKRPDPPELDGQWAALGKRESQIFPVQFRCVVPVDGKIVTGVARRD